MTSRACPLRYAELFQSPVSAAEVTTGSPSVAAATVAPAATEARSVQATIVQIEAGPTTADSALEGHAEAAQALPEQELADNATESQASTAQKVADCIVLRYNDPRAIYQRYVEAREAWYNAQPRESIKTNQEYRRAKNLPQRYNKAELAWCLDWKQMGKQCRMETGCRVWTKEEMMAYLDWDRAEDNRVEAMVVVEMEGNRFPRKEECGRSGRLQQRIVRHKTPYSNDALISSCSSRVQSLNLKTVSKPFSAMLGSNGKEGRQQHAEDVLKEIQLPDDDAVGMKYICAVMHHQNHIIPAALPVHDILSIAVLSDKYNFVDAFKFTSAAWLLPECAILQVITKTLILDYDGSYLDLVNRDLESAMGWRVVLDRAATAVAGQANTHMLTYSHLKTQISGQPVSTASPRQ
ncbi:transposase-like protein [Beauveria bassiana ARSEF 2860]|uniref:Transposase-like protein n=1 Tax=Beauveria bassiana (strain ARSEF 2860) TaxID=655819 RepID=J5JBR4_BEAB2|nr:transposase-like protein [Beauveria bassiana ARSEF 2860]EJP61371.1 transposase-like protein [Beauveria bassiana ARSEF 2860]